MLSDRDYMRHGPRSVGSRPYFWWLLLSVGVGYVVQQFLGVWFGLAGWLEDWVAVSGPALQGWRVWTVVSYGWLHGGFLHVFFNLLIAYWVGRFLLNVWGHRLTTEVFVTAVAAGGLVFGLLHLGQPWNFGLGSSAGVFALVTAFSWLMWTQEVRLMLFFVIPVAITGKWLFYITSASAVFPFLFGELPMVFGRIPGEDISTAHSAHLAGIAVGYAAYCGWRPPFGWFSRQWRGLRSRLQGVTPGVEVVGPHRSGRAQPGRTVVNLGRRPSRAEVDRILDKITAEGFGALTEEERRALDRAKRQFERR